MSVASSVVSFRSSGIEPFATPMAFRHASMASRGALPTCLRFPLSLSRQSRKYAPPPFSWGWLAGNDDEARGWLVVLPVNRIKSPQPVFGFTFLCEFDLMAFGVHRVQVSVSAGVVQW
jgi:hypothetical protein